MEPKEKIIDTAKILFSEKGYAATGLREISEKSGISLSNIYNYFKNKEEIFMSILDAENIILSLKDLPSILHDNFPDNLNKLILTIKQVVDENIHLYRLIFIDLIEFNGYNTDKIVERIINFVQTIYDNSESVTESKLRKTLDVHYAIRTLIVAGVSYFVTANILPSAKIENSDDIKFSSMMSDILLNGVLAK